MNDPVAPPTSGAPATPDEPLPAPDAPSSEASPVIGEPAALAPDRTPEPPPAAQESAPLPPAVQQVVTARCDVPRPLFSRDTRWSRALAWACLLVPLAAAAVGAALSLREVAARKAKEAVLRMTGVLRSARRHGDVVLAAGAPSEVLAALGRELPGVLGTPREELPLQVFSRVWVLDGRSGGRAQPAFPGLGPLLRKLPAGTMEAELHGPSGTPLFAQIAEIEVFVQDAQSGQKQPCAASGSRHVCAAEPWVVVEPSTLSIGGVPYDCIGAHPTPKGTLVLRFRALGGGPRFHLATALADSAGDVRPVQVEVRAGEAALGRFAHTRTGAWEGHSFDFPAGASRDVELRLSVEGGGKHHFCFVGGA